jgi:hypothetical protein
VKGRRALAKQSVLTYNLRKHMIKTKGINLIQNTLFITHLRRQLARPPIQRVPSAALCSQGVRLHPRQESRVVEHHVASCTRTAAPEASPPHPVHRHGRPRTVSCDCMPTPRHHLCHAAAAVQEACQSIVLQGSPCHGAQEASAHGQHTAAQRLRQVRPRWPCAEALLANAVERRRPHRW